MIVTFGTADGKTKKGIAKSIGPVYYILSLELFFHNTPFHVLGLVAVKGRSDHHIPGRMRHQVARQLPLDKSVVGHIGIKSADNPIPVG